MADLSRKERDARDEAFLAADGMSERDGRLWNEAWEAARAYYAPNADEAEALRERLGLISPESDEEGSK